MGRETWLVLLAGVGAAGVAAAIAWFLRKREREPDDVTLGFIGPSLAAMYLLVLALALATEWQAIGSAQQAVGNEAVAVRQVYWAASGLPPAAGNTLKAQVHGYLSTVIDHDWPEMERGTLDDASQRLLTSMSTSLLAVNTVTSRAANAQQYATGQLSALASSRAQRQSAAESRLPFGVLLAVIVTSLIVGVFPFFSGMGSGKASLGVAVLQAALIGIAIVVVFQLNNPFTGPLATGPGPISAVAAEVGARLEPSSFRSARRSRSLLRCCSPPGPCIPTPRKAAMPDRTRPGSRAWHRRGSTRPHTAGTRIRTRARLRPPARPAPGRRRHPRIQARQEAGHPHRRTRVRQGAAHPRPRTRTRVRVRVRVRVRRALGHLQLRLHPRPGARLRVGARPAAGRPPRLVPQGAGHLRLRVRRPARPRARRPRRRHRSVLRQRRPRLRRRGTTRPLAS